MQHERADGQSAYADKAHDRLPPRVRRKRGAGLISVAEQAKNGMPATPHPKKRKGQSRSADRPVSVSPSASPHDGEGHMSSADAAPRLSPTPSPHEDKGYDASAATAPCSLPVSPGDGHAGFADKANQTAPLASTIAELSALHRNRIFAMTQRMAIINRMGRFVARDLGWSMELPEKERKAIDARAAAMIAGKADPGEYAGIIQSTMQGAAPFLAIEGEAVKAIERLAKSLPVWAWAEKVPGLGAKTLGTIVALAGDLGTYPKKGHLWKRLGIACIDGVRQGSPGPGATAEDWIRHGYSKRKRALVFAHLVQPLMTRAGKYREIYLSRKAYEEARASERMTKMHIHRRAHRVMEQKLIRDLWRAWKAVDNDSASKSGRG